jgi:hypothetical protein
MGPTQISAAVILVGVAIVVIMWLQASEAAASARRMMDMTTRVGLGPGTARLGDPRTEAIRKEARRRCRRCPCGGLCDRWLAGEVEGGNAFCPNARTFRFLSGASGRAS